MLCVPYVVVLLPYTWSRVTSKGARISLVVWAVAALIIAIGAQ